MVRSFLNIVRSIASLMFSFMVLIGWCVFMFIFMVTTVLISKANRKEDKGPTYKIHGKQVVVDMHESVSNNEWKA